MKLGFSQQEIERTAVTLGLPSNQSFINRRIARAFDLVNTGKVTEVTDGIFRVRSQYEPDKAYIVNVNHGAPYCDCPDGERTINCKHRIASLLYQARQAQAKPLILKETTDDVPNQFIKRSWFVLENGNRCLTVVEELNRLVFCNCGAHYDNDCIHKQAVIKSILDDSCRRRRVVEGVVSTHRTQHRTLRIANECGSAEAKALQDKLNGQLTKSENSGNGDAKSPSQLDLSDPFQECEQLDIDQIEGRRNGEVTWKLSNGEYCISYRGIMTLAEKHSIEFDEVSVNDNTVIAKAKNGNERISGKPIYDNANTAIELAKRNAARQLLPLPEIKAVEKKAQLEAEFDWQKAKAKCVELVGEANVGIIIHDLTQAGKLRADNPSHYDRTEWLLIYNACQKDGGLRSKLLNSQVERDPKSLNRWSYNSVVFLEQCKEAIEKVRANEQVEAHEQPLENSNGKRKLQMDKKLNVWILEADGTKTKTSCREICEQFESKQNPGIVTRLRAGIDSGADISTVELN